MRPALLSFAFTITFACAMLPVATFGAPVWYELPYDHFSKNETLSELLMDFSSTIGIPVVISEEIKGDNEERVNGHFKETTAETFLMRLSSLYQVVWYYDGHMIYINHANEMQSELLQFSNTKIFAVKNTLKRLGVWDPRFNWREMKDKNLLYISGPPRYVSLVKEVSELIDRNQREKRDTTYNVRVFKLKYAWADDRVISHRGSQVVIPGVARTLQKILGRGGYSEKQRPEESKVGQSANTESSGSDNATMASLHVPSAAAYIEANSHQNSVIVYDLESRLELYDQLIRSLDVPVEQIEIEVSIIDIRTTRLFELGVDWQGNAKQGTFGFGDLTRVTSLSDSGLTHTAGADTSLTSVIAGDVDYFVGRIRLLEEDGDGQILSQPSVMTLNNVEAIIDNSTTFYVKLEGEDEVDLVEISAGSLLRVTPRIIDEDTLTRKIGLDVSIEDGQVQAGADNLVDELPLVTKSTITTQAVIGENGSLLVGGYYYDDRANNAEKVPFLGDIPVVKAFFSRTDKSRTKVARMFLITPRIVKEDVAFEKGRVMRQRVEHERDFESDNVKYDSPMFDVAPYSNPDFQIYE